MPPQERPGAAAARQGPPAVPPSSPTRGSRFVAVGAGRGGGLLLRGRSEGAAAPRPRRQPARGRGCLRGGGSGRTGGRAVLPAWLLNGQRGFSSRRAEAARRIRRPWAPGWCVAVGSALPRVIQVTDSLERDGGVAGTPGCPGQGSGESWKVFPKASAELPRVHCGDMAQWLLTPWMPSLLRAAAAAGFGVASVGLSGQIFQVGNQGACPRSEVGG